MARALLFYETSYSFDRSAGRTMIHGSMSMMIFILAAGYLFSVYLLLALAKRTVKKSVCVSALSSDKGKHQHERSIKTTVTEAVNSQ
ncbi:hypothetical protein GS682_06360 [Nostoc sp. B(2019)]|nr:hypothetical protein [Nostoc sp. B(2019)]